jgi:hypothetical protein
MHGFGPLEMTDELRREVLRIVSGGPLPEATSPAAAVMPSETSQVAAESVSTAAPERLSADAASEDGAAKPPDGSRAADNIVQCNKEDIATQYAPAKEVETQSIASRGHGGALPK